MSLVGPTAPLDVVTAIAAPDACALMRALAPHVDAGMLAEMAAADYEREQAQYLAALGTLHRVQPFDADAFYQAREAIELTRWSMPPAPASSPGNLRGHWMRAWASATLLAARCQPAFRNLEGQNQTLIQLIDSLRVLPARFDQQAAALAACLVTTPQTAIVVEPDDEDAPFFGLGLLWFALKLSPPVADAPLLALLGWISAREKVQNDSHHDAYGLRPGPWLLSTTHFDLRHDAWRALGADLAGLNLGGRSQELRDWIKLVGTAL